MEVFEQKKPKLMMRRYLWKKTKQTSSTPQNLCVKKKKQKHRVDPDAFWVAAVAAWPVASYSTMRNIAVNQFQQDQQVP